MMAESEDELSFYLREEPFDAEAALRAIGIRPHPAIRAFYDRYDGPFGSSRTGVELLAFDGPAPSVLSETVACRELFSFPVRALVLSIYIANALYVADAESGAVYNVDFEGGDAAFIAGTLEPMYQDFTEFLDWYFGNS